MNNIPFLFSNPNFFPRTITQSLVNDLGRYPAVAVMGARQVGKSTLCRAIAQDMGFASCTLDDVDTLNEALADPKGFVKSRVDKGLFIDEVQRAPSILLTLKAAIDETDRPGQFLLCGSHQPNIRTSVSDSLLGRVAYRTLRPLTLSELRLSDSHPGWSFLFGETPSVMKELNDRAEISGAMNWAEVVQSGGFPRVLATDPEHRRRLMEDYIQVFASRDIREVLEIESPDKFEQFIRLLAARTAQIQNHSTIANELGVAVSTVRRWVDALDRSYLINHIPAYSRNAGHRIIKSSKLVITDSALALAASRSSVPTGFHFETFIASDIAVWKDLSYGRGLYHWRSGSKEVDFILEEGNRLLAVEIKTSSTINYSDSKHLRAFMSAYPEAKRGILLSSDPTIRDLTSDIIAAPWWAVV